jgi:hypothetical protein
VSLDQAGPGRFDGKREMRILDIGWLVRVPVALGRESDEREVDKRGVSTHETTPAVRAGHSPDESLLPGDRARTRRDRPLGSTALSFPGSVGRLI